MKNNLVVKKCKFGLGVFADKDFKKGEKILKFTGKKIKSNALGKESERSRNILVDPLQIGDNEFLILDKPELFINHSCDPNSGFKSLTLYAIKNIKIGEEITYDYSSVWFEGMKCSCGKSNCRKHIGDFLSLPRKTQLKYKRFGIIPKFIINKIK